MIGIHLHISYEYFIWKNMLTGKLSEVSLSLIWLIFALKIFHNANRESELAQ